MNVSLLEIVLTSLIRSALVCGLSASAIAGNEISGIKVEAPRNRETLKIEVNQFVTTAMMQSSNDESLERWTYEPICPLVAGLSKPQGEFILGRLSQIAKAAGAPLGSEKCKPNFFVIISADPEPGLKRVVYRKGGQTFNYEISGNKLEKFVETPRPIRVWYNAGATSVDGAAMISGLLDTNSVQGRIYKNDPIVNRMPSMYGSRLNVATTTRDILSVIVVVDSTKVGGLNVGQLGDYIGMIGLAQIDLDKDFSNAPTILNLFRGGLESRPPEMTEWDKALLHALYSTSQRSKLQVSEMQTAALNAILAASAH